jgi:SAM-dependent MidA family methyltransferase
MFGELLAFQFARWLEQERAGEFPVQIVETGAHDGQLAHDILEAVENREPALFARIEYRIIEPADTRREIQQARLKRFRNVRWHESLRPVHKQVRGVIFSNELLDAMPVHPFAWNAKERRWEEMAVTLHEDRFVWTRLLQYNITPPQLPVALLDVLPNGYMMELGHAATNWWREAAAVLVSGRLLTIDYGGVLEELFSPGRNTGTLRAYSGHHIGADVLANPGEQDITAHVNFTEIINEGEAAGLKTETFNTQSQFLTAIARDLWKGNDSLPPQKVRQFQTLTHPEHLGRPFKVLVQSRLNEARG